MEFQALVPGSNELHLLCHVTLLHCQVDPNPKPKAKSKAKKSLLPLPIFSLMWQPLAHLNQCYSSNSLPFMQFSSRVVSALGDLLYCILIYSMKSLCWLWYMMPAAWPLNLEVSYSHAFGVGIPVSFL